MHPEATPKNILIVLALMTVFISASYFARVYQGVLASVVREGGAAGVLAFILLTAVLLIFLIPLDISVLIPLATSAWGPLATALMTVVGWTIGSAVAFFLARRYGVSLVRHLIGIRRVEAAGRAAPRDHLFWWALTAQALITIDIISYAFGLFTNISMGSYVVATGIGNVVPAFFFAYAGTLPLWYEVAALTAGIAVAFALFMRYRAHHARL